MLVYINDCLFFAQDMDRINKFIRKLQNSGFTLTVEDDIYVFLGVEVASKEVLLP